MHTVYVSILLTMEMAMVSVLGHCDRDSHDQLRAGLPCTRVCVSIGVELLSWDTCAQLQQTLPNNLQKRLCQLTPCWSVGGGPYSRASSPARGVISLFTVQLCLLYFAPHLTFLVNHVISVVKCLVKPLLIFFYWVINDLCKFLIFSEHKAFIRFMIYKYLL